MMNLTELSYAEFFPIVVAIVVTLLVVGLILLVSSLLKIRKDGTQHERQLDELVSEYRDTEDDSSEKESLWGRWSHYWGKTMREGGVTRYAEDDGKAGNEVAIFGVATAVIVSAIFQNLFIGPIMAVVVIWLISMRMKGVYRKNSEKIAYQLPGMLFALKANLQAADTSERAMIKVVDTMPSPLYEDLVIMRSRLLAGDSFIDALHELSDATTSRELKFLCACMIQATQSGANIESQIDNIHGVLKSRQKVNDEISKANKSVAPAIWLASGMIPALFLFSYFLDSSARDFWFIDPISWLVLLVVGGLYGGGMFIVRNMVNKIKNM